MGEYCHVRAAADEERRMTVAAGAAKDVVVFLEPATREGAEINRGLFAQAARIAGYLGGRASALVVGAADETAVKNEEMTTGDVTTLYAVQGPALSDYSAEVFAWASVLVLREIPFRFLLFAHSDRGSEIAPRIASAFNSVALTNCADIRLKENSVVSVRHVYGGQFEQEVSGEGAAPVFITMNTEALSHSVTSERKSPPAPLRVVEIPVGVPVDIPHSVALDLVPPDPRTVDILYARRIIGVGSGCSQLLHLADELAGLLEASIATTRPVVDDGLIPKSRMIGQTGKTVSPDLYLALGVSGSPHHVAGIQRSKKVLSINKDPRAPIFALSDTAFEGDLNTVLPKLLARIRRYRDEGL